jgi:hypothetical protein
MIQAPVEQVVAQPAATDDPVPAAAKVRRKPSESFLIAVGSLVLVYGVALGVMVAGGAIVHAFDPSRHVNVFAALHNWWVDGALIGVTALWLLPPYPWGKRTVAAHSPKQPDRAAVAREEGDAGVTGVSRYEGGSGPPATHMAQGATR